MVVAEVNVKALKATVEEIFDKYKWREDIEEALENAGFKLWFEDGDEQVWAYDKGTPNGQVLVLINWVWCFYWIYEKVGRGDI